MKLMKSYIYKLIFGFFFLISMGMLGEHAYGMGPQYQPFKLPPFSGTPKVYAQTVADLLARLPNGHPCKTLNTNQSYTKMQIDVAQCNTVISKQNEDAERLKQQLLKKEAELLKQRQEAELLRKKQEEAEKLRKQEENLRRQKEAELLKQRQEAELLRKKQEEAEKLRQQEENLRKQQEAELLKQKQEVEEKEILRKQQDVQEKRILQEKAKLQQLEMANQEIQQFDNAAGVGASALMNLIFFADDQKKRDSIMSSALFFQQYSEFFINHVEGLKADESVERLQNFLRIPQQRENEPGDIDNLEKIETAIDKGIDAITSINEKLQQRDDTRSEQYREYFKELKRIVDDINPDWDVFRKLSYLDEHVGAETRDLSILLGIQLLVFEEINRDQTRMKNEAFIEVLTDDKYPALSQFHMLINAKAGEDARKIQQKKEIKSPDLNKFLTEKLGAKQTYFSTMRGMAANALIWRKSAETIKSNEEGNNIRNFLINDLSVNIKKIVEGYQAEVEAIKNKTTGVANFVEGRRGARIQEIQKDEALLEIATQSGLKQTNIIGVAKSMQNSQTGISSKIEAWIEASLSAPGSERENRKNMEESLEHAAAKESEEYKKVLQSLEQIIKNAKAELSPRYRLYELANNIINLKKQHDNLIEKINKLETIKLDGNKHKERFLGFNISLLKQQFSEALHEKEFHKYLELDAKKRADLFSHWIKILGIDFPKAPETERGLAANVFPELSEQDAQDAKNKFKEVYDLYTRIKKDIQTLNLGGQPQQEDVEEFIDLNQEIKIPGFTVVQNPHGVPPPPPPGLPGVLPPGNNVSVKPAIVDDQAVKEIKIYQEKLHSFVESVKKWEEETVPKVQRESVVYKSAKKKYYKGIYDKVVEFYRKIGNSYPDLNVEIEAFKKLTKG